jgi:hypothetical protein
MHFHSLAGQFRNLVGLAPQVATTDAAMVGPWIDQKGAEATTFQIVSGTLADPDAVFNVTFQHADLDDKSDAAAISAADLVVTGGSGNFVAASDDRVTEVALRVHKRYVRMTVTPVGNTAAAPVAAIAALGPYRSQPALQA